MYCSCTKLIALPVFINVNKCIVKFVVTPSKLKEILFSNYYQLNINFVLEYPYDELINQYSFC